MKELGSRVTFVRRSSASNVTLRHTCSDMKVWSGMFAMNVRSVSVLQLNWKGISWCTQTLEAFAVVCVERILSVHMQLSFTLCGVPMVSSVTVFYEIIIFLHVVWTQVAHAYDCKLRRVVAVLWFPWWFAILSANKIFVFCANVTWRPNVPTCH